MKIEVEIKDNIYQKVKELFGDEVDLSQILSQLLSSMIVLLATYPEDFMAVFTRQGSPEQRQRIDNAMERLSHKALERAKHKQ